LEREGEGREKERERERRKSSSRARRRKSRHTCGSAKAAEAADIRQDNPTAVGLGSQRPQVCLICWEWR
jgi:hypothetical protein